MDEGSGVTITNRELYDAVMDLRGDVTSLKIRFYGILAGMVSVFFVLLRGGA